MNTQARKLLFEKIIKLNIWKSVKVGNRENKSNLLAEMDKSRILTNNFGQILLEHPSFCLSKKETEIYLVIRSVGEFGFANASLQHIREAALSEGLQDCPEEVPFQFSLQHSGFCGEKVYFPLNPIHYKNPEIHSDQVAAELTREKDLRRFVRVHKYWNAGFCFDANDRFVFTLPSEKIRDLILSDNT